METYLIEVTNDRAYRLLQDLEALKVIKVLEKQKVRKSRTAKFRGALALSGEQYRDFQQHAKEIREEWQKDI